LFVVSVLLKEHVLNRVKVIGLWQICPFVSQSVWRLGN